MKIMVIDDEASIRQTTSICLEAMGHECMSASTGADALREIEKEHFDAALLDLRLNQENGLDVLAKLLQSAPNLAVVVFTAHSSIDTAVEAMRRGAQDYLAKPFTPDQIQQTFARIVRTRKLELRLAELESRVDDTPREEWTTDEPLMQRVYTVVNKAAATPTTILLLGH